MLARILAFIRGALAKALGVIGDLFDYCMSIPGRILGSLNGALGGGAGESAIEPPPPTPQAQPTAEQHAAEARRVAAEIVGWAYKRQTAPLLMPPAAPQRVRKWLSELNGNEVLAIAHAGPARVLAHIDGQQDIAGVPPVGGGRRSEILRWRAAHPAVVLAMDEVYGGKDRSAEITAPRAEQDERARQRRAAMAEAEEAYESLRKLAS